MTLEQLTKEMRAYNNHVAYGSECNAWQDYHADCHETLGISPTDDEAETLVVPEDFGEFWRRVSKGEDMGYYEPATGARIG